MQVRPLDATFGAEIENLDFNDLSDGDFSRFTRRGSNIRFFCSAART